SPIQVNDKRIAHLFNQAEVFFRNGNCGRVVLQIRLYTEMIFDILTQGIHGRGERERRIYAICRIHKTRYCNTDAQYFLITEFGYDMLKSLNNLIIYLGRFVKLSLYGLKGQSRLIV